MTRYRLIVAAMLIASSSVLASGPLHAAPQLPWINYSAGPVTQPNCPTGSQSGCFAQGVAAGGNATPYTANANYSMAAPFSACMQMMQVFMRMSGGYYANY